MTPATFRSLRVQIGTQRVAARELGIAWRTIQRIEQGNGGAYGNPIHVKFENMILGHGKERGL